MKVLIACEESQTACKAFRERGHEAYSCDIQPPSGGHPEWHVQGDALKLLRGGEFETTDGQKHFVDKWDLLIAHPPCTYLTVSGNRWFNVDKYGDKARKRIVEREDAAAFFMAFINAPVEKIAVENPVGYMSSHFRKPDCIIQPFQFGEHARKGTCLWLKNLQPLTPTKIVDPGEILPGGYSVGASANFATDANGKILRWNDPRTQKSRSKTFPGIAKAMAEQWGSLDKEAHNGSIH